MRKKGSGAFFRRRRDEERLPTPFFVIAIAALLVLPARAQRTQRVTFRTADGVVLSGSLFEASARLAPAVILVHMQTRNRRDWEPVASRLAAEGIAALAFDLRGHGESAAAPTDDAAEVAAMIQDVAAARQFLGTRADVQHDRIGIAGASLGADLALVAASLDPTIRTVALLSPALEYRGLRIDQSARKYAPRPLLLVASREDAYALRTIRELMKGEAARGREQLLLDRAGHGTVMFSRDGSLIRLLVDWFHRTI